MHSLLKAFLSKGQLESALSKRPNKHSLQKICPHFSNILGFLSASKQMSHKNSSKTSVKRRSESKPIVQQFRKCRKNNKKISQMNKIIKSLQKTNELYREIKDVYF